MIHYIITQTIKNELYIILLLEKKLNIRFVGKYIHRILEKKIKSLFKWLVLCTVRLTLPIREKVKFYNKILIAENNNNNDQ